MLNGASALAPETAQKLENGTTNTLIGEAALAAGILVVVVGKAGVAESFVQLACIKKDSVKKEWVTVVDTGKPASDRNYPQLCPRCNLRWRTCHLGRHLDTQR